MIKLPDFGGPFLLFYLHLFNLSQGSTWQAAPCESCTVAGRSENFALFESKAGEIIGGKRLNRRGGSFTQTYSSALKDNVHLTSDGVLLF